MATHAQPGSSVKITREGEVYVAKDEESGVASQGRSKPEALINLAEALALHSGEGEEIEDPDEFLAELGIEPETRNASKPPWEKDEL